MSECLVSLFVMVAPDSIAATAFVPQSEDELAAEGKSTVPGDQAPCSMTAHAQDSAAGPKLSYGAPEAFLLYDTHGFPLDLTEQMAQEAESASSLQTSMCSLGCIYELRRSLAVSFQPSIMHKSRHNGSCKNPIPTHLPG